MISDFVELTKPRLTLVSLFTVLLGFMVGISSGPLNWMLLFHAMLGSALTGGGANALNEYLERDTDARMLRTADRPLPSGRLRPSQALIFGLSSALIGPAYLYFFVNPLTAACGVLTLFSYLCIYTPLKRITTLNTFAGAVSGAMPPVMGVAAATGDLGMPALILFSFLFVWQLPHFYSIAWIYREDYLRGGFLMTAGGEKEGGHRMGWQIFFFSLLLIPVSLTPVYAGLAGQIYFFAALTSGVIFLTMACGMIIYRMTPARRFMAASIIYLSALIVVMIADRV